MILQFGLWCEDKESNILKEEHFTVVGTVSVSSRIEGDVIDIISC